MTTAARPLLLDLFCGAGGAAVGYYRAGFDVVGVDIAEQPRYPFEFHQADALEFPLEGFDAIHASPPCQAHSAGRSMPRTKEHRDLVAPMRDRLLRAAVPWVIENVEGAPLITPIKLCGSSFGLWADGHELHRHRLFESNVPMMAMSCIHNGLPVLGIYGDRAKTSRGATLSERSSRWSRPESLAVGGEAMGIDWMTWRELREAIPPVFTEHVGGYLVAALNRSREAAA